eukprot:GHVS01012274.1.p1 GENE.GHVS01012274.1~~GHVS01012274.1.p1  ORF type:complete len:337 (+),score=105.05 GHVS01012274.1:105-1115(+)
MGSSSSRPSPPPPPPPTSFPPSLCNTTKCGSAPADLSASHRGRIFLTVQQIPLDYIKYKKVLTCQVVNIPDGDTIRCRHLPGLVASRHPTRRFAPWRHRLQHETMLVRLYGVDAPERRRHHQPGQPFAEEATKLVEDRLLNKVVFIKLLSVDQYGRALCRVLYLAVRYQEQKGGEGKEEEEEVEEEVVVDMQAASTIVEGAGGGGVELSCEGVELQSDRCRWFFSCFRRNATSSSSSSAVVDGQEKKQTTTKNRWKLVECDVCEDLLMNGYACMYRGYGAVYDDRYDRLAMLEKQAKKAKRGMWSIPKVELPADYKTRNNSVRQEEWRPSGGGGNR